MNKTVNRNTGGTHHFRTNACRMQKVTARCSSVACASRELQVFANFRVTDSEILCLVPHGVTTSSPEKLSLLGGAIEIETEQKYGDPSDGDYVTIKATVQSPCAKHVAWTIQEAGGASTPFTGGQIKYQFLPPVADPNLLKRVFRAVWLKDVTPRIYQVQYVTCKDSAGMAPIEVRVYPNAESEVHFRFGEGEEDDAPGGEAETISDLANMLFGGMWKYIQNFVAGDKSGIKKLKGDLKLTNKWEEDSDPGTACWTGSLMIGLDPIIGFDLKTEVVPALAAFQKVVPDFIRKWVNMSVYLEVSGDVSVHAGCTWSLASTPSEPLRSSAKGEFGGKVGVELGAKGWIGQAEVAEDSVIYAALHGNSSIEAEGGPEVTDQWEFKLEGSIKWPGIAVTGDINFWHGTVSHGKTWTVIEEPEPTKFGPCTLLKFN